MRKSWILLAGCLGACAKEVKVDATETTPIPRPAAVRFDPANQVIPFPNNLVLNPQTGRVTLPSQCGEGPLQTQLRAGVLNSLNGFATLQPAIQITFDKEVDVASIGLGTATQRIRLYKRATGATPVDPAQAALVPFLAIPGVQLAYSADCATTSEVHNLTLVPALLDSASTYTVAVLHGLKAKDGTELGASATFSFVRESENPVGFDGDVVTVNKTPFDDSTDEGLAQLQGLDLLWRAHVGALRFLDIVLAVLGTTREDIDLVFEFNTQNNRGWADPAGGLAETAVDPGTGAALSTAATIAVIGGAPSPASVQNIFDAASPGLCAAVSCNLTISHYVTGEFLVPGYQPDEGDGIPLAFDDPYHPTQVGVRASKFIAFVPAAPLASYRTVIFGHGFTRKKEDLFALASRFAAAGIATVAMDWPLHGERAIQISDSEELGCEGTPDPYADAQCFASLIGLDLGNTRDNLRQAAIEMKQLAKVIYNCGLDNCGPLKVDPLHIGYMGQSLGSLIGSTVIATTPEIKAAVLNVGAGLWVDVLLNSQTPEFVCPIVNGLIEAGLIVGELYPSPDALCLGNTWKSDPAVLQFSSIARWVLDPVDGANFIKPLKGSGVNVLLQEVVGDTVVPNVGTTGWASLFGLAPVTASTATTPSPSPTPAAADDQSAFIRYITEAGVNEYNHGSILAPVPGTAGLLGTVQMQTDAVEFLNNNL